MNRVKLSVLLCLFAKTATSIFGANLRSDESLILFPAAANPTRDGRQWEVTIRGWVFEPERRTATLAVLQKSLHIKDTELTPDATKIFANRAAPFLYDNERGKRITIRIGDKRFTSDKSDANGHFKARFQISADDVRSIQHTQTNGIASLRFFAVLDEPRAPVASQIFLLSDTGLSVISDIDDTIKISEVRDHRALLRNTFLKPFTPVSGMAAVYQKWATNGAQFHYVSASPWQLFAPLAEFTQTNGFPAGSFQMRLFRWKDRSFFQLLGSPEAYKLGVIEPLLKQFPQRRFVLVGDSGEKDPEIYGLLARRYPKQITQILIREATNENLERYHTAFKGIPETIWLVFRDPGEIAHSAIN